ncbi:hypothetical protein Rcae01_00173 [Novipirellula caenicola]|uniref:Uncharacterized protein n=1 Tax=Novipirellula caenicola TaxID=1536901 RepID=A0ABP9VHP4_9BACT
MTSVMDVGDGHGGIWHRRLRRMGLPAMLGSISSSLSQMQPIVLVIKATALQAKKLEENAALCRQTLAHAGEPG